MTDAQPLKVPDEQDSHAAFDFAQTETCHPKACDEGLRVIVADDSPTFIEVVCALLEPDQKIDGVARASDGVDAIEAPAKLRPDLVLMDIDMPMRDGLNAARIISARFPETRILLMSAAASDQVRAAAPACGEEAFIEKTRFRTEFLPALGTVGTCQP